MFSRKCANAVKVLILRTSKHRPTVLWTMSRNASLNGDPQLKAEPLHALVDDTTKYTVTGLEPKQEITLAAVLQEGAATFVSHAHYNADQNGDVDVTQLPSSGGSYKGIESMGLIWAMTAEEGSKPGMRLMKKDVTKAFNVQLSVLAGHRHITSSESIQSGPVLCSLDHPRSYMAPGVRRIPVREGRLRGTLFLPPGDGPFPGVMDLFGTAGGLTEFRSALFASRGLASFALAYFGYDDLPKVQSWDMEYFEEAVDWLSSHPDIQKEGIGAIGVSKGTELVTYMAIHSSKVKAVISINGYYYYSFAEHFKNGVLQPAVFPDWTHLLTLPEGLVIKEAYWKTPVPEETTIPIELAKDAEFLFINGEDDYCASVDHTDVLMERLRKHGKSNFHLARYPGAGHLIEPPYTPHCREAYHKLVGSIMLFGGHPREHSYAEVDVWHKSLEFLHSRLGSRGTPSKL